MLQGSGPDPAQQRSSGPKVANSPSSGPTIVNSSNLYKGMAVPLTFSMAERAAAKAFLQPYSDLQQRYEAQFVKLSIDFFVEPGSAYKDRCERAKATQNPEKYFGNNATVPEIIPEILKLPIVVPELRILLEDLKDIPIDQYKNSDTGQYIRTKLLELFALASLLTEVAGHDFHKDPEGGFLGRLKKVFPPGAAQDPGNGGIEIDCGERFKTVYSLSCAIYGRALRMYYQHSLELCTSFHEAIVDREITTKEGRSTLYPEDMRLDHIYKKLDLEVLRRLEENIKRDMKNVTTNWLAGVSEAPFGDLIRNLNSIEDDTMSSASVKTFAQVQKSLSDHCYSDSKHIITSLIEEVRSGKKVAELLPQNKLTDLPKSELETLTKLFSGIAKVKDGLVASCTSKITFGFSLATIGAASLAHYIQSASTSFGHYLGASLGQSLALFIGFQIIRVGFDSFVLSHIKNASEGLSTYIKNNQRIEDLHYLDRAHIKDFPNRFMQIDEESTATNKAKMFASAFILFGGIQIVGKMFNLLTASMSNSVNNISESIINHSTTSLPTLFAVGLLTYVVGRFWDAKNVVKKVREDIFDIKKRVIENKE